MAQSVAASSLDDNRFSIFDPELLRDSRADADGQSHPSSACQTLTTAVTTRGGY